MEIAAPKKIKKHNVELQTEQKINVEKQTVIRSWYSFSTSVRIWKSTCLICNQTGNRSRLVYSDNVGQYPNWKWIDAGERFLMVFEALPERCITFDLYEDIPEPGEFHVKNILKNKLGVYDVPMW